MNTFEQLRVALAAEQAMVPPYAIVGVDLMGAAAHGEAGARLGVIPAEVAETGERVNAIIVELADGETTIVGTIEEFGSRKFKVYERSDVKLDDEQFGGFLEEPTDEQEEAIAA